MRKLELVLAAALMVGSATVATAQDPQPQAGQQRAVGGRGMGMLLQGITLTAEQQTKVDSIQADAQVARQAVIQDQSLDGPAKRSKIGEMMTKQSDAVRALLTDDQKKVFDKNQEDMRARMQQGGGRPPQR
jgi:periplasmic protein CpxP/Spy